MGIEHLTFRTCYPFVTPNNNALVKKNHESYVLHVSRTRNISNNNLEHDSIACYDPFALGYCSQTVKILRNYGGLGTHDDSSDQEIKCLIRGRVKEPLQQPLHHIKYYFHRIFLKLVTTRTTNKHCCSACF